MICEIRGSMAGESYELKLLIWVAGRAYGVTGHAVLSTVAVCRYICFP